jgi:hypothetical protein
MKLIRYWSVLINAKVQGENINTNRKIAESLLDAGNEVGLDANAEKTMKCSSLQQSKEKKSL